MKFFRVARAARFVTSAQQLTQVRHFSHSLDRLALRWGVAAIRALKGLCNAIRRGAEYANGPKGLANEGREMELPSSTSLANVLRIMSHGNDGLNQLMGDTQSSHSVSGNMRPDATQACRPEHLTAQWGCACNTDAYYR